jgi:hypothetical protein
MLLCSLLGRSISLNMPFPKDLPAEIKLKVFALLCGKVSIVEFEQWVYQQSTDLEAAFGEASYLALVSSDFSKRDIRYQLAHLLKLHIDVCEYETWRLRGLLKNFLRQEGDSQQLLQEFYELYCQGLYFLEVLGLGYACWTADYYWLDSAEMKHRELLSGFLVKARQEAQKILDVMESGTITITQKSELGNFQYIDNREKT